MSDYHPSAGTGGHLLQHPRLMELPETYRHPRHFWVFNLPEQKTQIWLGSFKQIEEIRQAYLAEQGVKA